MRAARLPKKIFLTRSARQSGKQEGFPELTGMQLQSFIAPGAWKIESRWQRLPDQALSGSGVCLATTASSGMAGYAIPSSMTVDGSGTWPRFATSSTRCQVLSMPTKLLPMFSAQPPDKLPPDVCQHIPTLPGCWQSACRQIKPLEFTKHFFTILLVIGWNSTWSWCILAKINQIR